MRIKVLIFICTLGLVSCHSHKLPTKKYNQFTYTPSHSYENKELKVHLSNPIMCPIRIWLKSSDDSLQNRFQAASPIELQVGEDSTLVFENTNLKNPKVSYSIALGSPKKKVESRPVELPFPRNRTHTVIQGNNTDHTHNTDYSRYAIDFKLKVGDTISSVSDGFVVGVIDQYQRGGKDKKWRPYGNYLTIYDSTSGVFYQYVHLTHKGSFVEVGDQVKSGQPIGLSGKTGQTDVEHLHFNSLIPIQGSSELKSIPVEFKEGYTGTALKKSDIVRKP